jgi:hypothetical protein
VFLKFLILKIILVFLIFFYDILFIYYEK